MKPKTLHTHSMLPRTLRKADNYPEYFYQNRPFKEDLLTQPRINIRELIHAYILEVALPGFAGNDLHVYINDSKLFIQAFTKQKKVDKHLFLRNEFNPQLQIRIFLLPSNIDKQHITTKYRNGMLEVTLLKTDQYALLK